MFLLKINSAVVIRGAGTDKVSLRTELPCATWPYTGEQDFSFEVAAGKAEEYLKEHFPDVPFYVINMGI